MTIALGIDVGATSVKAGLVDLQSGKTSRFTTLATPSGRTQVLEALVAVAKKLVGGKRIAGVGVGFPSPIDLNGRVLYAPNLKGFDGFPLENELARRFSEARLRFPLKLINDAKAAALGEFFYGGWGSQADNMVVLTLGTGIGCGIVEQGRLVRGSRGFAGEAGHMLLNGVEWEALASATAVKNAAAESGLGELHAKQVALLEKRGNAKARRIMLGVASHLAQGIQVLVQCFNPSIVVLAGQMSQWRALVQATRAEYEKLYSVVPPAGIRVSKLRNAGVAGAAALFK